MFTVIKILNVELAYYLCVHFHELDLTSTLLIVIWQISLESFASHQ